MARLSPLRLLDDLVDPSALFLSSAQETTFMWDLQPMLPKINSTKGFAQITEVRS